MKPRSNGVDRDNIVITVGSIKIDRLYDQQFLPTQTLVFLS
jgi:hypothetical protein